LRRYRGARLLPALLVLATTVVVTTPAQAGLSGSCVVKVTRFEFQPNAVHAGERTRLWLRTRNCTDQTLDLTEVEFGERIPPCPTVDPIGRPVRLGPFERFTPKPLRMVAPPCNGVEVMVVKFSDSGGTVLARRTATLHITMPSARGHATGS
jgi:hypothetical protein